MHTLRVYQTRAVEHVRSLRGQYRLALKAPTGSGKTVILGELLQDPRRQLALTHRCVLFEQLARSLTAWGVPFGCRASGYKPNPKAPVQLSMIQTELRRDMLPDVDVVHIDEIHTMKGPAYKAVFDKYHAAGASILGYTATPSDLGDLVDNVHDVVGVAELIEQGHLCPPRVYSCGTPDVKLLEKLRRDASGEYLAGDVNKIIKPQYLFGPVVEHYEQYTDGSPFVLYAHSVKASIFWAQSLTSKGIPTAHIDGDDVWVDGEFHKSDSTKRAEVFKRLERGDLAGVSNRFVLREGWDLPCVSHVILTCPMALRKTFVQACGRAMRPSPGKKHCIIQDHSGSCLTHPPLDSDAPWDWQAAPGLAEKTRILEMKNDTTPEPIVCPKCKAVRATGDTCPYCGFHYPKLARYVIQVDGSLRLVEGKSYVPQRTQYKPGDEKISERLFWSAVKNNNRTPEQCRASWAYMNDWRWLPRDLPYFPKCEAIGSCPGRRFPASV